MTSGRGLGRQGREGNRELSFHVYPFEFFFIPCAFISYTKNKDFEISSGSLFSHRAALFCIVCREFGVILFLLKYLVPFSPLGNNTCFYGKCYYCRETEPACADGDTMEGSVTLWLPDVWPLQKHRHPWGRTYREGKLAR